MGRQGRKGLDCPHSSGIHLHNPLVLSPTSQVGGAQPARAAQQMKSEPSRQIPGKMDGE